MSAQRIQLSRTKGWRKPDGAVVVSRPSRWGNPFKVQRYDCEMGGMCWRVLRPDGQVQIDHLEDETEARSVAVDRYRWEVVSLEAANTLAGHDLACWCPLDQPCHADVLLEIANRGAA